MSKLCSLPRWVRLKWQLKHKHFSISAMKVMALGIFWRHRTLREIELFREENIWREAEGSTGCPQSYSYLCNVRLCLVKSRMLVSFLIFLEIWHFPLSLFLSLSLSLLSTTWRDLPLSLLITAPVQVRLTLHTRRLRLKTTTRLSWRF